MYPATEIALHLAHVCAAQRRPLATLRAATRALHVRHQPAPHHAAQAKAPAAVQIAGKAGAVGNAREASRPQSAPAEFADDGRPPSADRDLAAGPQQARAPRFISGKSGCRGWTVRDHRPVT
jgi:hypothetical protein